VSQYSSERQYRSLEKEGGTQILSFKKIIEKRLSINSEYYWLFADLEKALLQWSGRLYNVKVVRNRDSTKFTVGIKKMYTDDKTGVK
jgi:hypothetical protein